MKTQNLFNVAVYIRLSKEDGDKEESDSVGNQKKLLTDYVLKQKHMILYDIYVDDGYTGTNFNRPGFRRMLADIKDRKANCVIVKDLSRFGRDYIDTGRYLERIFPEWGVRFISLTDGIDSMKQAYDMLLPIKNIFNEQYARDISKKVHTAVKTKQTAGEFIGAFPSYGYRKSPADKNKLVIDEYAASIVRRIFSLYIQGYGKQKIAGILNSEGVLCPSEYKQVNGENYINSNRLESTAYWSYSTINSILHKEIYAGNMVQGTKHQYMRSRQKAVPKEDWIIVEHTHEPIIDQNTWEKAQTLLTKRTGKPKPKTTPNIWAGFVKCGDCGRAMTKNGWRRADGSKTCTFYCGTYRRQGKKYCSPHAIPEAVLEEIVRDDLRTILHHQNHIKKLVESELITTSGAKEIPQKEVSRIKTELERIKRLQKQVYEDYKDSVISREEFLAYREDYQKKEELYIRQLKVLDREKCANPEEDRFHIPWMKKLMDLKEIESLDRETVVEMISEIRIYENHKIKIIYNFENEPEQFFSDIFQVGKEK